MAKYLFIMGICSFVALFAKAAEHSKKSDKVYVLQGPTEPVKIESESKVASEDLIMRDPNLVGEQKNQTQPAREKIVIKPKVKTAKKMKTSTQTAAKGFKPMKISATSRLPRVAFSKLNLPVGIREESKPIDFIDRSLDQMP